MNYRDLNYEKEIIRVALGSFTVTLNVLELRRFDSVTTFILFKGAAIDPRYLARSKFSRSLVHKENFTLI